MARQSAGPDCRSRVTRWNIYIAMMAGGIMLYCAVSQAQQPPTAKSPVKKVPSGIDIGSVIAEEQSRLRSSKPQGKPVSVSLFAGPSVEGRTFVFVIDRSKSMQLGALASAEQQLLTGIQQLRPHHRFQVIAYNNQCRYLRQRKMLEGTDENKKSVAGFLIGLPAVGTTEHEMALLSALQHAPDVLYLLTDGGDPELTDAQIRKLTKVAGTRTAIHCVQFGFGPLQEPKTFLRQLAVQNRGTFVYADLARSK